MSLWASQDQGHLLWKSFQHLLYSVPPTETILSDVNYISRHTKNLLMTYYVLGAGDIQ